MPATYAHFKLGRELLPRLRGPLRKAADAFPRLYDIGLHGPDILFYHQPLKKTVLNRMASPLHDKSGRAFFTRAAGIIGKSSRPQAALAYTAGALCHFAMDVTCHGYVEEMVRTGRASHAAIEADLDRALLVNDGKAPFAHRMAAHIRATRENARVIAPFYPRVSEDELLQALRDMRLYTGLLHPRLRLQRLVTRRVLAAAAPRFGDLVLPEKPDPRCREITKYLLALYPRCLEASAETVRAYTCHLTEQAPLEGLFRYTFNGQLTESEDESL